MVRRRTPEQIADAFHGFIEDLHERMSALTDSAPDMATLARCDRLATVCANNVSATLKGFIHTIHVIDKALAKTPTRPPRPSNVVSLRPRRRR